MQTGGHQVLTDAEQSLNARLLKMKQDEVEREEFPPAMHFFKARELIRNSPIFKLLQKMPKGTQLLTETWIEPNFDTIILYSQKILENNKIIIQEMLPNIYAEYYSFYFIIILLFAISGGALHLHDFSMVDVEWLVKNATYRPHCYICFTSRSVRFIFSSEQPKPLPNCSSWTLLESLRAKTVNTTDLDNR